VENPAATVIVGFVPPPVQNNCQKMDVSTFLRNYFEGVLPLVFKCCDGVDSEFLNLKVYHVSAAFLQCARACLDMDVAATVLKWIVEWDHQISGPPSPLPILCISNDCNLLILLLEGLFILL
jgi:hypothetical protein